MRWSKYFLKTTRSAPKDATLESHKLLHKGGFIRQISTGRYALLPLGMRVNKKIMEIMEEELDVIGAQRMELPIMQPIEVWEVTNRDKVWGSQMIVVDDHYGRKFALSATAESLMAELVKSFKPSYKDLPINIYQFLLKFRDELRPRGGMIRAREFLMMDAYNFESSEKDFMKTYENFKSAYTNIFSRMGLETTVVEADSGALGGDYCHEFMVEAKSGGDRFVACNKCDYKANVERAEFIPEPVNMKEEMKKMEVVDQPEWVDTMANNIKHYGKSELNYLKNVVFVDGKDRIIIAVLRGDLEANPTKISKLLGGVTLRYAEDKDIEGFGSKSGWVHSWGHDKENKNIVYVADSSLKQSRNLIGGQKEKTTDTINVNYGKDFKHEIEGDISLVREGSKCAKCKDGRLKIQNSIEVGHIFKYDHYYTEPHKAFFTDKDGKEKPMWMGAYGIGFGRAIATVAEIYHDEKGLIWPKSVSPFLVHLITIENDDKVVKEGQRLYDDLTKKYPDEIFWDDRDYVSAGVKFNDADLIGVPFRVVVSKKTLGSDKFELKLRGEEKSKLVDEDELWRVVKS